jgi:hypothetical protein
VSGAGLRTGRRRRGAKACVGASRSPLTALIVALSLIVQLIAIPHHQALAETAFAASDTAAIARELKATFGDAATLCVQVDDKGAPLAPTRQCDDQCPLCRFAAQAAALKAPDAPALPARLDVACRTTRTAPDLGAVPVRLSNLNRARAPPLAV